MFYRILGIELFDALSTINLDKLSISDLPITASPHFLFATLSFIWHSVSPSQQRLGPFFIKVDGAGQIRRYHWPDGSSWYWWYFTLNGGQSDTGGAIDGLISSDRPMTQILSVKAFQWYTITADAMLNEIFDQLWDGLFVRDVIVSRCFILCIFPVWVMLLSWVWFFIGPESDHWECLSVTDSLTHWLTHSCLVNLIDVTLACEYDNSKLVEVVTVVEVVDEKRVDNSLVQIWKVNFGHKV